MKKLLWVVIFFAVLGVAGGVAVNQYSSKKLRLSEDAIVEIKKGASLTSIAQQLARLQLIVYPRLFVKLGQLHGLASSVKYGEYLLSPEDSYYQVLQKITSGQNYKYEITLVEGDHMYKLASQLEAKGLCGAQEFLDYVKNPEVVGRLLKTDVSSLEGYLFPDTYFFAKTDGVPTIVESMVRGFFKATEGVRLQAAGLSRHEIVTLASIVEKETGAAFERPQISSVFHNRLKKGMRLQTDPTIIYGIMNETGKEIRNIRKSDIRRPTAYNTYVIKGLPPGPIGNPGLASIKAAVAPAATPFLYFVSRNDGTHVFSESYKGHQRAVKKFQLNPAMRAGKSWRDLKKKKDGSQ